MTNKLGLLVLGALFSLLALPRAALAHDTLVVQPQPPCALPCAGYAPLPAHAAPTYLVAPPEREPASAFRAGFRGLFAGSAAGIAVAYLATRGDADERGRKLGLGAAIGGLAGAGLGVSLGILDAGRRGTGYYVARDMLYGVGFGAAVGAVGGSISLLAEGEAEHVALGAAIGAVAGLGLGMLTGFVEGHVHGERQRRLHARGVSLHLAPAGHDGRGFVSGVSGRF